MAKTNKSDLQYSDPYKHTTNFAKISIFHSCTAQSLHILHFTSYTVL